MPEMGRAQTPPAEPAPRGAHPCQSSPCASPANTALTRAEIQLLMIAGQGWRPKAASPICRAPGGTRDHHPISAAGFGPAHASVALTPGSPLNLAFGVEGQDDAVG